MLPPFCRYHPGELLTMFAVEAPADSDGLNALYMCPSIGGAPEKRPIDLGEEAELYLEAVTGSDGPVAA